MIADILIHGKTRDLGGFSVSRILPQVQCRHLGPFVFLDHLGPMEIDLTHALDVRPHPHIGLATVTYLFEGRGLHRDSLGSVQAIEPGDINWMTAGSGIVHSERTPPEERKGARHLHGIQIWVALPVEHEECECSFVHYPRKSLGCTKLSEALSANVLIGQFGSNTSPVQTLSPMLLIDFKTEAAGDQVLSFNERELGVLLISGECSVNGQTLAINDLLSVHDPKSVRLWFSKGARFIVLGGAPFVEPRYMWWNFVSSRKERIHEAAARWKAGRFPRVPGEFDWIPLPNDPLP